MHNGVNTLVSFIQQLPSYIQSIATIDLSFSMVALQLLREIDRRLQILREFVMRMHPLEIQAFTSITDTTLSNLTSLDLISTFDMDSSFWVCNNLATGHICNNKSLFADELIPSIYEVGSATGVLTPTLMGTVVLRITDNEGDKHSFTLKNVNYLPDSLVNLLSLCHLAELYPNDVGHPDQNGTGISSGYDNHTLFWDKA
jgi:hypothetical protein